MSELFFMVTFTGRRRLTDFLGIYKNRGARMHQIVLGLGTADNAMLNLLGIESREKAVIFSVVSDSVFAKIRTDLYDKLYIGAPDTGVVFTVPVSSVGGRRELSYLTSGQNFTKGEESALKDTKAELLVIISNQGYNELVMDSARSAGARGGTVIHAKGTGIESAEKFFGFSLAAEKDITFIVTETKEKNRIMQAVMKNAGFDSPAKAVVFSLPVTETAGLKFLSETETTDEKEAKNEI